MVCLSILVTRESVNVRSLTNPFNIYFSYAKTDWNIWTAATVTDTTVRDSIVSGVYKYASDGLSSQPFGDWYETKDGTPEGFRARPVVGGHLALVS